MSEDFPMERPPNLLGRLTAEAPATLGSTVFYGNCEVGAFTYFNAHCEISNTTLGRYCSVGQYALINPGHHPMEYVSTHPFATDPSGISCGMNHKSEYVAIACTDITQNHSPSRSVKIQHDVWIGAHAIIMPGVTIHTGAVIGANSVVTRDVPPFAIVAGSPARLLRYRLTASQRDRLLASKWWTLDLSLLSVRDYSDVDGFLHNIAEISDRPLKPPEYRFETLGEA